MGIVRVFVSVAVLLAACEPRTAPPAAESASALPAWTLGDTPDFLTSAETLSGESLRLFRINGGTFDSNGDAVVAAGGRVLVLDARGEVAVVLGAGDAGGEIRTAGNVFAVGDHLAVWDPENLRIALFRDRALEEVIPLRLSSREVVIGLFNDGTIVTGRNPGFDVFANADSVTREGEPTRFDLWDRRGNRAGTLEGPPAIAAPYFRFVHRREGSTIYSTDVHGGTCLPELEQQVQGDRILVVDGKRGVLHALSRSGELTPLMRERARSSVGDHAVSRLREMIEETESYVEPVLDDAEREVLAQLGDPGDPLPSAWSAMVLDGGDGSIWLRRAACFPEDPAETWDVVDADGLPVATVTIPGNLRTLAVVGDRVLGVLRNPQGTDAVAVFRVQK